MSQPFEIVTVPIRALADEDRASWLAVRAGNPALESPYHHPDYHALVDAHQGGGNVTIVRDNGFARAFLPWQGGRFARPSGAPLSDYQALITAPDFDLGLEKCLSGQAIGAFHYTAMPDEDGTETARMEIGTAEDWRAAHDKSYRRHLKSTRRRIRKAEEEIGPRRVVMQSRDIDAYRTLLRWKRDKFAETGKYDVLFNGGNADLLRALWERGPGCDLRADLHVLYFGDRMAAADLGLTDGHVFHSWIVGYDPDLLPYAPGIQLLEAVIDDAEALGYGVIDLGPGTVGYKRHYATHSRHVGDGVVTVPSAAGWMAAGYDRAESALRQGTGDALGKLRRRYSQIAACEPGLAGRSRALLQAFGHSLSRPAA